MPMFHDLKIKKIINETDKSVIISFIVPKELSERFVFIAGQFISIKAIIGNKEVIRDYSICSHISEDLSIGVKKIHNGLMSSYLKFQLFSYYHYLTAKVASSARFELATLCLEGRCSIQLSYEDTKKI